MMEKRVFLSADELKSKGKSEWEENEGGGANGDSVMWWEDEDRVEFNQKKQSSSWRSSGENPCFFP